MKLYLSSFRLGKQSDKLVAMASTSFFAVIPNALDAIKDEKIKQAVIDRAIADLKSIGLESTVIDLRDYFDRKSSLLDTMAKFQNVFVTGGNVFVLRRAMAQSGFDNFLRTRISDSKFLYAAYSAGACICAPSLRSFDLVDDPYIVPSGYDPIPIFDGLSIISHSFLPHYKSDHHESEKIDGVIDYCILNKILFRAYRDGEVLIE